MFEMIFEQLKGRRCAAAVAYFQARADMLNAITAAARAAHGPG